MNSIETATPREIADYLNYLTDTAWKKAEHKTDEDSGFAHEIWRRLYDVIFSEEVSKKIHNRFKDFDYYDPDTSYYRDIMAFVNAFTEYANNYADSTNSLFPTFEEYLNRKDDYDY